MSKDHITVSNVAGGHLLTCAHCGATMTVPLPMEWREWKAVTGRFWKQHRHCPSPAAVEAGTSSAAVDNESLLLFVAND